MSLTPEQWLAMDEAEKACAEAKLAMRRDPDRFGIYWARQRELSMLTTPHLRTLIDAARPKCGKCDGSGGVYVVPPRQIGPNSWVSGEECPDCDGTGWAR